MREHQGNVLFVGLTLFELTLLVNITVVISVNIKLMMLVKSKKQENNAYHTSMCINQSSIVIRC